MTLLVENLNDIEDEALLERYKAARKTTADAKAEEGRIEHQIFRRMEERGANGIPSDRYKCALKLTHTYSSEILVPLIEIFSTSDLATCYTPEHQETVDVAAKWDVRKALPMAKSYGDRALSIVERAKVERSRSVDFGEK